MTSQKELEQRARSPETPPEELTSLARQSTNLARLVARNEQAPEELLRELGSHSDTTVRKWVTSHPVTPPDVLLTLAQQFPEQLLDNPMLDLLLLENPNLFAEMPIGTVRSLMKRPKTPAAFIRFAMGLKDEGVELAIAQNRSTPTNIIERLSTKGLTEQVRAAAEAWSEAERTAEEAELEFWVECTRKLFESARLKKQRALFEALLEAGDLAVADDLEWVRAVKRVKNPEATGEELIELARNSFAWVRKALLARTEIPDAALMLIANTTDAILRISLAKRKHVPPSVLTILMDDKDVRVKEAVAENRYCPPNILEHLAEDSNGAVCCKVAKNPTTQALVLERLSEKDSWIRRAVAGNPNTPAAILEQLAKDKEEWVRNAVAKNRNTPADSLEQLAKDKEEWVRYALATNPNIPIVALELLATGKDEFYEMHEAMARNLARGRWTLSVGLMLGRRGLAENTNASSDLLRRLAWDRVSAVREVVAKNPNTAPKVLTRLAKDREEGVRMAVAKNPKTPAAVLKQLVKDQYEWVGRAAALNPNISGVIMKQTGKDPELDASTDLTKKPYTLAELLERLAKDKNGRWVRTEVASHPNVPPKTWEKLLRDKDLEVIEAAAANPSFIDRILAELPETFPWEKKRRKQA